MLLRRMTTDKKLVVISILLNAAMSQLQAADEIEELRMGIRNAQVAINKLRIEICYSHFDGNSSSEANIAEKGRLTYQFSGNGKFSLRGTALALDIVKCRNEAYGFYLQRPMIASGSNYHLSWLHQISTADSSVKETFDRETKHVFGAVFCNYHIVGINVWEFIALEGLVLKFEPDATETKRKKFSFKLDPETALSKSMEITHGELVFDPECSWALTKMHVATSRKPGQYVTQQIVNFPHSNGVGLVQSSVFQHYSDRKVDYFQRTEFRNINQEFDDAKFYMSAYGFEEPNFGWRWGIWVWILLIGIILIALSVWIRKRKNA